MLIPIIALAPRMTSPLTIHLYLVISSPEIWDVVVSSIVDKD